MLYFIINLLLIVANETIVSNFNPSIKNFRSKHSSLNLETLNKYQLNFYDSDISYDFSKINSPNGSTIYVYRFNSAASNEEKCIFYLEINLDRKIKNSSKAFRRLFNSAWTTLKFTKIEENNYLNKTKLLISLEGTKFYSSDKYELGVVNSYISCTGYIKDIDTLKNSFNDIAQLEKKEDKI